MRLMPKQVGEPLSIDDYNAIVYLLKHDYWAEETILSSESYTGNFGTYKFADPHSLFSRHLGGYVITKNIEKIRSIHISITDKLIPSAKYVVQIKYRPEKTTVVDNVDITTGGSNVEDLVPESDSIENRLREQKARNDLETFETELDPTRTTSEIVFPDDVVAGTMIYTDVIIKLDITEPELDFVNGVVNEPNEILIHPIRTTLNGTQRYTYDLLNKLVKEVPQNGKKHIFRLIHESVTVFLREEIEIQEGQNIEIRGGTGTGHKTLIDGTYCGRLFHVRAGGQLVLKNLRLENCQNNILNSGQIKGNHGYGGAILVSHSNIFGTEGTWGVCSVFDCDFKNCIASSGGAIACYDAKLYVNKCTFNNCHAQSTTNGGAIYYNNQRGVYHE